MTLKIFVAAILVAGLGLGVVGGPTPFSLNPLGQYDDGANWELKEQHTPEHQLPDEGPTPEEIAQKNAENLARTVAHAYDLDMKAAPADMQGKGILKDADVELDFEGFEGAFPPTGWTTEATPDHVPPETWHQGESPYEGTYNANIEWDPDLIPQDEWLISESYDLSTGEAWKLDFWWMGSYHWMVTNPNCTLTVHISTDGGSSWTPLWNHFDFGTFDNWVYNNTVIDLDGYLTETDVMFGFQYHGSDGAQVGVDAVSINDAAPPVGRCCYGADFLTCEDLTQAECDDLGGHWNEFLNCTDNPCPEVPPNDEPENAITITNGETVTGSTAAATVDCPGVLDWEAVWYRFDAPYAENDVHIDYCGTPGDISTVGAVVYEEVLPLDCNTYIIAADYAFVDCGDGFTNPNMDFTRLPGPATYLFPVYADDGTKAGMDFQFDFALSESPPLPPGGSCSDPYPLTIGSADLPMDVTGLTTCGMGNVISGTSCLGSYDGGEDFIMELTLTEDIDLNVDMTSDASWTGLAIASDCSDFSSCIADATGSGSDQSLFAVPLTAGTYYIIVDTWPTPDCIPNFQLSFSEFVPSGGDNCSDPVSVKLPDDMTQGPDSDQYIDDNWTCGRLNDYENTCLGSYDGGEDIIYELDVAGDMTVDIEMSTSTSWTGLMIADACGDVDPCIASATGSTGDEALYGVELTTGFYYIMVDTWPSPDCIPSFTLTISPSEGGPENDDYADCTSLVGEVVDLPFNTNMATFDGPGGCLDSPNLWYCWEADCDGLATISLCGSGYDTKLAVYGGTDPTVDPLLGCNDDACGLQSELEVGVTAGNVYLIEVGGYGSSTGEGILNIDCVDCPPPPNDNCEDVTPVVLTSGVTETFTGNNECATEQCADFPGGHTWEAFTIETTSDVYLDYCGTSPAFGNAWLNLAIGCPCTDFTAGGDFNTDDCGDGNVTIFWDDLPAGTYYYPVMKDPENNASGPYTINVVAYSLSELQVDPAAVDFGVQAAGSTGSEQVDLTVVGGTPINYSITYIYNTKGKGTVPYTTLGLNAPEKGPVVEYVSPATKQGGDDVTTATVISGLPYYDTGTTDGYVDDYDEVCPFSGSTSPDVVYEYTPSADITVTISLCESGYDTKLYLYENSVTAGSPYACNDDADCALSYRSKLEELDLFAGNTYYIVIDGYGGASGDYTLDMFEYEAPDPFECPPGAGLEPEDCGDDTNGGCNMTPPSFTTIECGDTICGTVWADGGTRDTDWYQLTLYQTTTVTLDGSANFPFVIGFVDTADCALAAALDPYATGSPDEVATVSREAGPGVYYLFVSHQEYEGYPCGTDNDYWIGVDCPEGPVLWLSATPETGTLPGDATTPLSVNYDATDLEEGTYSAEVVINHDGAKKGTTTIPVDLEIGEVAPPSVVVDPVSIDFGTVVEGETGSDVLTISNGGGGSFNFDLLKDYGAKDLSGSYIETDNSFAPGETSTITLDLFNASTDWEWVMFVDVTFPVGVSIGAASNFVNPSDPGLLYQGNTGQVASWGDGSGYLDAGWSNADIDLTFDAGLTGDLTVDWYIEGDGYGDPPHDVSGTFNLPLFVDPATHWLSLSPETGTCPPDAPITVGFDATDLPGGVYTCDIVVVDDIPDKGETRVPVTIAVYEWDHVALDPDPVLAIEQNAVDPKTGTAYVGEMYDLGGYTLADVASATVNGLPATLVPGSSHPLVQGTALGLEFDLRQFCADEGWPEGVEPRDYDIVLTFGDASTMTISDEFDYLGHISGDLNMNGEVEVSDLVEMVTFMFSSGPAPEVMATMDVNGDCSVGDVSDLVYMVTYMFSSGPEPGYCTQ
jgi:hypothetical protein